MRSLPLFCLLASASLMTWAQEMPAVDWEALNKTKPWEKTEVWEPKPPKVTPGVFQAPPSDAIVLFDGTDLSEWRSPMFKGEGLDADQVEEILSQWDPNFSRQPAPWHIVDGEMEVAPRTGSIETQRAFGDCQLHIEWLSPTDPGKEGQAYSNSGIFLMGLYEIQVLNSYDNETYANGQAGSMYKQHIPLVNASRKPGTWQYYDLIFTAPRFAADGTLQNPARITALHNGVLVLHEAELKGPTVFVDAPRYIPHPAKMPLRLQDHGDRVRFRNIWIREL